MEADEVYDNLSEKISAISDKLSEFQGTIDYLQSSLTEQKSAIDKTQSDIEQIKDSLQDLKSSGGDAKPVSSQPEYLKIEAANAAAEKKAAEQAGLIEKLGNQVGEIAKTFGDLPTTVSNIASKAVEDGKKEILNIWDNSKKDLINVLSDKTTAYIKEKGMELRKELTDEFKDLVLGDLKDAFETQKASQPTPLTDEQLTSKIHDVTRSDDDLTSKTKGIVNDIVTSEETTDRIKQIVRDTLTTR